MKYKLIHLFFFAVFCGDAFVTNANSVPALGTYSAMTESEWGVAFELLENGKAVVTTESSYEFDKKGKRCCEKAKKVSGTWEFKEPRLKLKYDKFEDSFVMSESCIEKRACFKFEEIKTNSMKKSPLNIRHEYVNWDAPMKAKWVNPTGKAAIDHDSSHIGIDLEATPGETLTSPLQGEVVRIDRDIFAGTDWAGIVINGADEDKNLTVRILGVTSKLKKGDKVKVNDSLGVVVDATKVYFVQKPYVHLEVYEKEKRIDPTDFANKRWPKRKVRDPGRPADSNGKIMDKPLRLEREKKYSEAVAEYRRYLKNPRWETVDIIAYNRLAQTLANVRNFKDALSVNAVAQELLDLEANCSPEVGKLPDPKLGVIASCRSLGSTQILKMILQQNAAAYLSNAVGEFNY